MELELLEQIVEEVKNGNQQEYSKIVTNFQKQLYSYIYCIVNNTYDAEDVLQDTFVTAFHKINQYKENTMFSAWLYRIAKNLSFDYLKRRKRMIPTEREEMDRLTDDCVFPEHAAEGYDDTITDILTHMNVREKNILLLRIYQEKSYEEIAYIINKSESAARKQYERAKKRFIKLYEDRNKEEILDGSRKQIKSVF